MKFWKSWTLNVLTLYNLFENDFQCAVKWPSDVNIFCKIGVLHRCFNIFRTPLFFIASYYLMRVSLHCSFVLNHNFVPARNRLLSILQVLKIQSFKKRHWLVFNIKWFPIPTIDSEYFRVTYFRISNFFNSYQLFWY